MACGTCEPSTYMAIGNSVAMCMWVVVGIIAIIKPIAIRFYKAIGLPLNGEYDTELQDFGYFVFLSDELPLKRAAGWLLWVLIHALFAVILTLVSLLLWPVLILFPIVWFMFSMGNKTKED